MVPPDTGCDRKQQYAAILCHSLHWLCHHDHIRRVRIDRLFCIAHLLIPVHSLRGLVIHQAVTSGFRVRTVDEIEEMRREIGPEPPSPRDADTSSVDKKISEEYMVETVA